MAERKGAAPKFFRRLADFRRWLEKNHADVAELWVGFHKKGSGKPSITWPESVDEALSFGWIDGVRRTIDETSYEIRFTPRRPTSIWSAVNTRRAKELIAEGRMAEAGISAFEKRSDERSGVYSFEQRKEAKFDPALEARFRARAKAWRFFEAQPPGYRRLAAFWVMSAKKEETRLRRLAELIARSANGERLPQQ
jgi:uncharacterized protein YdeI (YjbR/CyaY-like superfamily)